MDAVLCRLRRDTLDIRKLVSVIDEFQMMFEGPSMGLRKVFGTVENRNYSSTCRHLLGAEDLPLVKTGQTRPCCDPWPMAIEYCWRDMVDARSI